MKTQLVKTGLLIILFFSPGLISLQAQCPGGLSSVTITKDTTVSGTGNDSYTLSLPKFDPSLGTLTSVTITSDAVVNYIYSIGNTRVTSALFKTRILRTDDITSTALDPSFISQATQTPLLSTVVPGNTTVQVGPSTMNYTVSEIINDSRVANFMGAGTVDFSYDNTSFVAFSGPSGSNVDFTQLNDILHFSVKYTYCTSSSALASGISYFTALKKNSSTIQLNWQQLIEEKDRLYTIQVSTDGKQYNNTGSVAANPAGLYTYSYNYSSGYNKKFFFRIMQQDKNQVSYSSIAVVDAGDKNIPGMHIFPTAPSDKITIVFNKNEDRKITLYSLAGQPLWTNTFRNSAMLRILLPAGLQKGMYIVEAVNLRSHEREVSKIVMQ